MVIDLALVEVVFRACKNGFDDFVFKALQFTLM